jgi:hypothetical protein
MERRVFCQRRMKGGDPKGYNRTPDEDDYDPDEEERV